MSRFSWPRALGVWALLLPGVVAFQPTFGGLTGYLAAFVGVTLGLTIAAAGHVLRWRLGYRFLAILVAYLLTGGPLALPETTVAGILPSLDTVQRLALLMFQGWSDLLTVATPAGDISGPAAVPLLAGLVAGSSAGAAAMASRSVQLILLIPLGWLALAIAFGVRGAPTATWLGAALGVGVLVWQAAHRLAGMRDANAAILLRPGAGMSRRLVAVLTVGAVALAAAGLAVGVNLATGAQANRQVLRDDAVPPLQLHAYTSPVMRFRHWELDKSGDPLFEVRGMPENTRLRLAVLDSYDGIVFNVDQKAKRYLRSGRELPSSPSGATRRVEIIVGEGYEGVWVPTFGESARIDFTGEDGRREGRGLYFNKSSQQALTTNGLTEGSTIVVDAVPVVSLTEDQRKELTTAGIGRAPLAEVRRVPDALSRAATDWTGEATSAYHQLSIIAERMLTEGYFSDGSEDISRSGHTAERLGTMFSGAQWVGDDEQYAAAMALMASQLGIPTRVVLGFHPDEGSAPSDVWTVTGDQAHVWVEANLDGAGWVAFDPTPADKPQTDAPKPKPKPKPQVDPPPEPPERLPEDLVIPDEDATNVDEEDQRDEAWLFRLLVGIGIAAGAGAVVSAPFLTILVLKRSRARRRATRGELTEQLAGAWDEVVDRARDLGHSAATTSTRQEVGIELQGAFPEVCLEPLARAIDAAVFGPAEPLQNHRDQAWEQARAANAAMLACVPWYRRPGAVFSTTSLRRRKTETEQTRRRAGRPSRNDPSIDAADGVAKAIPRRKP